MPKTNKNLESLTKEYSLTKEEKQLLESQNSIKVQYEYLAELIRRDIYIYVNNIVRKRLGVSEEYELKTYAGSGKVFAHKKEVNKSL